MVIVSDSIAKYLEGIEGVDLKSFPGDTIAKITYRIDTKHVRLDKYDYILLHVGTDDTDNKASFDDMISDFGNLIGMCRKRKSKIKIIISSVLPRPVDYVNTNDPSRRVNGYLDTFMSKKMNFYLSNLIGHLCIVVRPEESCLPKETEAFI